jgi:hypothetical protein
METITTNSSFITDIRFEAETNKLRITINGMFYYYEGITRQKVSRLKKAVSMGRYFSKYIKGKYPVTKRKQPIRK